MFKKIMIVGVVLCLLVLVLACYAYTAPVVVLHYAANASEPVAFFFNDDNNISKDTLYPGTRRQFRTATRPHAGYFIEVSLPLTSQDGVEIKPPFSRVDIYIGPDARIATTAVRTDFMARFRDD